MFGIVVAVEKVVVDTIVEQIVEDGIVYNKVVDFHKWFPSKSVDKAEFDIVWEAMTTMSWNFEHYFDYKMKKNVVVSRWILVARGFHGFLGSIEHGVSTDSFSLV